MSRSKKSKSFWSVNWLKTLYFNFKMFPLNVAWKLPIFFYGSVKFSNLSGKIKIDSPIKTGMIGFGKNYEWNTRSKGIAEIVIAGKIVFKGYAQFGKDCFLYIGRDGLCELGNMVGMATNGKLICVNHIKLGEFVRMGSEVEVIDTHFHQMLNTKTGEHYPKSSPIELGKYNYVTTKVSINPKTKTPDYCTVASNSLCNKDYTSLGENILIGGIPARLLKKNIVRDWEGEKENLMKQLIVH